MEFVCFLSMLIIDPSDNLTMPLFDVDVPSKMFRALCNDCRENVKPM
jgi:hypothetical protein